ncbi:MAG: hypothetical protein A2231_04130 [Candidatus Firestonebacteria bacterium RIFOXYA2_FULL_40_8]|nr:MAG: hypothetical protein A2231_04130 [Candidatus Firestonebacteria bacterium RIFOXYA2_FULL_40_8]
MKKTKITKNAALENRLRKYWTVHDSALVLDWNKAKKTVFPNLKKTGRKNWESIKIVILFLFFGLTFSFAQTVSEILPVTSEVIIEKVLKDFFDFCAKSKSKDPEVEELIKDFKKKVEDKKFILLFAGSEESVFPDFAAMSNSSGNIEIPLKEYLAGNYEAYPSIMYSNIVVSAAYYRNSKVTPSEDLDGETLPVDKLIKCFNMQAKFIDKYLSKSKLKLTPYEKTILTSCRDNNLYDFLFKYYAIDAEWLDYLKEVFSSESTAKGKMKQLRDIGEKKIEESKLKLKESASEEEIYNALVMPAMYGDVVAYYVYILTDAKKSGKSIMGFDWTVAADPKLVETMTKLQEIITPFSEGLKYRFKLKESISKIPVQK